MTTVFFFYWLTELPTLLLIRLELPASSEGGESNNTRATYCYYMLVYIFWELNWFTLAWLIFCIWLLFITFWIRSRFIKNAGLYCSRRSAISFVQVKIAHHIYKLRLNNRIDWGLQYINICALICSNASSYYMLADSPFQDTGTIFSCIVYLFIYFLLDCIYIRIIIE